MIARILVTIMLIVLAGGFVFFAGNVIWLGTKAFFQVYGPKSKTIRKDNAKRKDEENVEKPQNDQH